MSDKRAVSPAAGAGSILGAVFHVGALARRGKPIHRKGAVFDAVVRRTGSAVTWGAEWLDEEGVDIGMVRLSASLGLPRPWPDIGGLALTFAGGGGARHDLLLATTGVSHATRFMLVPRRRLPADTYGSLFAYRAPRGLVMLAAMSVPLSAGPRPAVHGPSAPDDPLLFRLFAARPMRRWEPFGVMELTHRSGQPVDLPIRFDPVRYVVPGLSWPAALAQLRSPAYVAAQRTPAARCLIRRVDDGAKR